MKKFFTLTLLALLAFTGSAMAQSSTSVTVSGGSTNSLLSTGSAAYRITIANAGSASSTVRLINAPSTDLTYTIGAYSNRVTYVTNMTEIYTNVFLGNVLVTNTVTKLFSDTQVVAASTNNYPSLLVLEAPAGETTVYNPISPVVFDRGLLSTNGDASGNLSITIDYTSLTP